MIFMSEKLNAVMAMIGRGQTQVHVVGGNSPEGEIAAITFRPLGDGYKSGDKISNEDESTELGIGLFIESIEGLEVIENALAVCRERLSKNGE